MNSETMKKFICLIMCLCAVVSCAERREYRKSPGYPHGRLGVLDFTPLALWRGVGGLTPQGGFGGHSPEEAFI